MTIPDGAEKCDACSCITARIDGDCCAKLCCHCGARLNGNYVAVCAPTAAPVQQVSVLDGWKLVPVNATEAMLEAGYFTDHAANRGIYNAMLAAAPAAPAADAGLVEALKLADWSGVNIGNKALISAAIEALTYRHTAPAADAGLVAALQKIMSAHKFNVTALVPSEVHAIAHDALYGGAHDELAPSGYDDLWSWFGMSYSAWLTLPRSLMHAMPDDWQKQMAGLLDQWDAAWNTAHLPAPYVSARDGAKFTRWPEWLLNYRGTPKSEIDAVRAKEPKK